MQRAGGLQYRHEGVPQLQLQGKGKVAAAAADASRQIPAGPRDESMTHSLNADMDAMDIDGRATPMSAPQRPAERPPLWHTFPQEAGGPDILQFTQTMKDDAAAQEHVVELLGPLLDKTIQRNDMLGRKSELAEFEAGKACPLTASAYLKRIMKYGGCSPCCVVVGLMYLQRLKQRMPTVCLTSGNMQRLLLTSVMVAAKFLDDLYYSNKHWAQIGGLNLQELNTLELKLLFQLSFAVGVTREEYQEYLDALGGSAPSPAKPSSTQSFKNVADASHSFRS
jgi:hypothetical protein